MLFTKKVLLKKWVFNLILEKIKMLLHRGSNSEEEKEENLFVSVPDKEGYISFEPDEESYNQYLKDTQMKELGYQVFEKYQTTNLRDIEGNIIANYENKIKEQLLKEYKLAKYNSRDLAKVLWRYMPTFEPDKKINYVARLLEKRSNNLISFTKRDGVRLFSEYDLEVLRTIFKIREEDKTVKNINQAVDIIIEHVKVGNSPRSELQWILK